MQLRVRLLLKLLILLTASKTVAQTGGLQHRVSVFSGFSFDLASLSTNFIEEDPRFTFGLAFTERIYKKDKFALYTGLDWSRYATRLRFSSFRFEDQVLDEMQRLRFVPTGPSSFHFIGIPLVAQFSTNQWQYSTVVKPSIYSAKLGLGNDGSSNTQQVPALHCSVGQSVCYVANLGATQLVVGPEISVFVNRFDAGWSNRRPIRFGCELAWAFGKSD